MGIIGRWIDDLSNEEKDRLLQKEIDPDTAIPKAFLFSNCLVGVAKKEWSVKAAMVNVALSHWREPTAPHLGVMTGSFWPSFVRGNHGYSSGVRGYGDLLCKVGVERAWYLIKQRAREGGVKDEN